MKHCLNRREFLGTSSSLAAATVVGVASNSPLNQARAADENEAPMPIIDPHQHLWDLSVLELPWLKNDGVDSIRRSFVMSDYLTATADVNVVKTIYMEVNVTESHQVREAEYVINLCECDDNPMAGAVIGGYPHTKQFMPYAVRFSKSKCIKGFRTVLHDPDREKGLCLTQQFVRSMKLLGKLGLSFDLCMRPDELLDAAKLADKCPQTNFILDHCGNLSVENTDKNLRKKWKKGIKELAQRENVVCKISGIIASAKKDTWKPADLAPNIDFCMDAFGENRSYFAGDWPVCTLKASFSEWVNALKTIVRNRSPESQRKLFHDNAARVYGLT